MIEHPSARHRIEQSFHDAWATQIDLNTLLVHENFEAQTACENRFARTALEPLSGKKLLDLGCGAGETSVYFALQGAFVTALDLSREMLSVATQLGKMYGVCDGENSKLITVQSIAERLPFADASFDGVFGNGVLHHVELKPTLLEVKRILKPGGTAVFIEPLSYNPLIWVYRFLAKNVRTPTEKPFSFQDLSVMKSIFGQVEHREFWLTTLSIFLYFFLVQRLNPSKVRYWKRVIEDSKRLEWLFLPLKRWDDFLLSKMPWLGRFCWNSVIVLKKDI